MRYLTQMGLVERRSVPRSRRDRFRFRIRIRDDAWYATSSATGGVYEILADFVVTGIDAVGGLGSAPGDRLSEMHDFFRFVHADMAGLLDRWRRSREQ